jgi:2-(1,2-epoxy-1,2-dihydrophenyl)acetyl-CoA isomerase
LADEALRIGLLNQVVPSSEVAETAIAMAARIAANSATAVRALKEIIDLALPIERALEYEREVNRGMGSSADSAARFRQAAARVIGTPSD